MTDENKIFNINVGVLGHVDSGKTSLTKALSTMTSTASMDKSSQSQERGITLDLGFSAFQVPIPPHLQESGYETLQFTLVDCPGHASLIKTIIGGAQIIDKMFLVIDVTKGIQTQTAECLVVGEIMMNEIIVVLNKIDLLKDPKELDTITAKLRKVFAGTKFGQNVLMVPVSACPGGGENLKQEAAKDSPAPPPTNLSALIDALTNNLVLPQRNLAGSFYFAIDHCFSIKGQGTVLTGTVLHGSVAVNQVIELAGLDVEKKVKSLQMFKKPVQKAIQGDRLGICVTQLDPSLVERGVACAPGTAVTISCALARVDKIRFFKGQIKNRGNFHLTIGHFTTMATVQFFHVATAADEKESADTGDGIPFNWDREYAYSDELYPISKEHPVHTQWALLEFVKPLTCRKGSIIIGSKLDSDIHLNSCRLAFSGNLCLLRDDINLATPEGRARLKVCKQKVRVGSVDRVVDDYNVIGKDLFSKETDMSQFIGLKVTLDTGEEGRIEGGFGKGGKFKVYFPQGLPPEGESKADTAENKDAGKKPKKGKAERSLSSRITLRFKKYVFNVNKKAISQEGSMPGVEGVTAALSAAVLSPATTTSTPSATAVPTPSTTPASSAPSSAPSSATSSSSSSSSAPPAVKVHVAPSHKAPSAAKEAKEKQTPATAKDNSKKDTKPATAAKQPKKT